MTYPCQRRRLARIFVRLMGIALCLGGLGMGILSILCWESIIEALEITKQIDWQFVCQCILCVLTGVTCPIMVAVGLRFVGGPEGNDLIRELS